MIIVAAPSGAGKSSFVDKICQDDPRLLDVITYTTRPMRRGETEGKPYHFVSIERFQQLLSQNYFVEHASVHGKYYGTPYDQLEKGWEEGRCVIMDIDVQGAETFKRKYPESKSIFIIPPSIDELRKRVIKRDGKVPADLEVRMKNAEKEMACKDDFDFQIINDEFESSYKSFKKIIDDLL
jgi:guanylate kinase